LLVFVDNDTLNRCCCDAKASDSDDDSTPNCIDFCSNDPAKATTQFGCVQPKTDTEGDSMADCVSQECPVNLSKTKAGICGCGTPDIDTVSDGTYDYKNQCSNDPLVEDITGCVRLWHTG